jgi:hypothetical protein
MEASACPLSSGKGNDYAQPGITTVGEKKANVKRAFRK